MGAPSKRAKRTRLADEFDISRLAAKLYQPRDGQTTIGSWSFEEIAQAREEQMLGQFVRPSRMVEQFRTDDALAVAYENRLAPQRCIPVALRPAKGARALSIADEAEGLFGANGVGITPDTIADIHGCLVDHGVAFGVNVATPRADGTRIDIEHHYWPIEYVRWDPLFRVFKARADPNSVQEGDLHDGPQDQNDLWGNQYGFVGGYWLPVIHGDGRWVIYKKHDNLPFRKEAAILPAALVWARHAFAIRDWSMGSKSHGSAKVIGELPAGVPLQGPAGALTAEASAFIQLMQAMAQSNSPVGIRPAGSKTDYVVNTSTAWQVWQELVLNAEKAAARIYLGTDGTLGTQGGAPGVDITALFGVAATKVRGDLECLTRGIDTGIIQPWCAMNFGDSKLAPSRQYLVPDSDKDAVSDAYAKRNAAFYDAIKTAKDGGLSLTPGYIGELASDYRVRVPLFTPAPAASPEPSPSPEPKESSTKLTAALIAAAAAFDESKHPRGKGGKFGKGSGEAPAKKTPKAPAKKTPKAKKPEPPPTADHSTRATEHANESSWKAKQSGSADDHRSAADAHALAAERWTDKADHEAAAGNHAAAKRARQQASSHSASVELHEEQAELRHVDDSLKPVLEAVVERGGFHALLRDSPCQILDSDPEGERSFADWGAPGHGAAQTRVKLRSNLLESFDQVKSGELGPRSWAAFYRAKDPQDFRQRVLIHELGHHLHLSPGLHPAVDREIQSVFDARTASGGPFVSAYAKVNHEEFFAETHTAYVCTPDQLKARDPEAFQLMRRVRQARGMSP